MPKPLFCRWCARCSSGRVGCLLHQLLFLFLWPQCSPPLFFCQESSENKVLLRLKGQGLVLHLLLLLVSPPRCENSAPWLLPGVRTGVTLVAEGAGGGGNHLQVIKIQR